MIRVTFEFENQATADHFASWMCGSGEQQYWMWMEYREMEEEGPITALGFNYNNGKFYGNVVTSRSGRMDEIR